MGLLLSIFVSIFLFIFGAGYYEDNRILINNKIRRFLSKKEKCYTTPKILYKFMRKSGENSFFKNKIIYIRDHNLHITTYNLDIYKIIGNRRKIPSKNSYFIKMKDNSIFSTRRGFEIYFYMDEVFIYNKKMGLLNFDKDYYKIMKEFNPDYFKGLKNNFNSKLSEYNKMFAD